MNRRVCRFRGHVQGVGFRYTVSNLALQYDVKGYVRNLADGTVEVVMEGPESDMDDFVGSIREKMGTFLRDAELAVSPATGEFSSFTIRR